MADDNGPLLTLWLFRLAATIHTGLICAQPVLAGSYLGGNFDALGPHGTIGSSLIPITMITGGIALLFWLFGRGKGWPVLVVTVLFFAESLQVGFGHTRVLAAHIPLGVGLVVGSLLFTGWLWTSRARRPRPSWRHARPGPNPAVGVAPGYPHSGSPGQPG